MSALERSPISDRDDEDGRQGKSKERSTQLEVSERKAKAVGFLH